MWRVNRTHFFPDKGIPKATHLTQLREKYGKETQAMDEHGNKTTDDHQVGMLLWLMDEQGHPATLPDPSYLQRCRLYEEGNRALLVETPMPTYGNKDLECCLSSYTAVHVYMMNGLQPELFGQMQVNLVSLPLAWRAGNATMK